LSASSAIKATSAAMWLPIVATSVSVLRRITPLKTLLSASALSSVTKRTAG